MLAVLLPLLVFTTFLALGPVLKDPPAFPFLKDLLPGKFFLVVPALRMPSRIFAFSLIVLALLVGMGTKVVTRRLPYLWASLLTLVLLIALFLEYFPARRLTRDSIDLAAPLALSDTYGFLARENDRGAVVELPSFQKSGQEPVLSARYTYASSGHLRRVVAYHASVPIEASQRLQDAAEKLPDAGALRQLVASGVSRLVVHTQWMEPPKAAGR